MLRCVGSYSLGLMRVTDVDCVQEKEGGFDLFIFFFFFSFQGTELLLVWNGDGGDWDGESPREKTEDK